MSELLSPAGSIESFYAAISNGADAVYLGLDKFSARAYAENFNIDSIKELTAFAHLRNVKVYITINTIVYDDELEEVYSMLNELAKLSIDAVIVQDLAVANYIISRFNSMEAHASTQMGVDDLDAATFLKKLGFKRIVFARETPIKVMRDIKNILNIEIEAFVHGALCVSYSGNCYMSSAIGDRSGNRGRCAGCCRKYYTLVNYDTGLTLNSGYLLSMKDLNTSEDIKDLSFIDSLKIEGRMKEPSYVASVTNTYRKLLDNSDVDTSNLDKIFNRTYTKGFSLGDSSSNITNIQKPNNNGYFVGIVTKQNKNTIWVKLSKTLNKGDQVNIDSSNKRKEISIPINRLFDANFKEVNSSNKLAIFTCTERVEIGAKVYKTKDIEYLNGINKSLLNQEYKKIPVDFEINCYIGKPLIVIATFNKFKIFTKSENVLDKSITKQESFRVIEKQLSKLNDTPYKIGKLIISGDQDVFIPVKLINSLRRKAISKLNEKRLEHKISYKDFCLLKPKKFDEIEPKISVEVSNETQEKAVRSLGIENIYYKNVIRRNNVIYPEFEDEVLVNGYGGINHYLTKNRVITDSSLNVVNHQTVAILSSLGVDRITLSQEISKEKIELLIKNYVEVYNTWPNLELIVYGRSKIMHTKYCPLKRLNMCGKCKNQNFGLKDDFAIFPMVFNDDCTMTLLNSRPLNLLDNVLDMRGINYYRFVFTNENPDEIKYLISNFICNLKKQRNVKLFDKNKHTRGHFINNPL